jgi:hypothetical protein
MGSWGILAVRHARKFYEHCQRSGFMKALLVALLLFACVSATTGVGAESDEVELMDNAVAQVLAGVIIVLFFLLGFVLYYFVFNKESDEAVAGMSGATPGAGFRKEMDSEEKKVLEILKKSEGMGTQKELRGIMKCTDRKMSLLVSSLEERGLVKRIKRGREKIVKLCK